MTEYTCDSFRFFNLFPVYFGGKGTALVSFGYSTCGGKNTLKTSVQYKQVSAQQWTDAGVTFASNTAFTYGRGQISTETSYDVRYILEDAFSTISVQEIVSTAAVVMDFKNGGKGVAIGKVSESDNTFEVAENWDVKVYGMLLKEYCPLPAKIDRKKVKKTE